MKKEQFPLIKEMTDRTLAKFVVVALLLLIVGAGILLA